MINNIKFLINYLYHKMYKLKNIELTHLNNIVPHVCNILFQAETAR